MKDSDVLSAEILRHLQVLGYSGVQCTDQQWLQSMLYEAGCSRAQLLQWLLLQFDVAASFSSEDHTVLADELHSVLLPLGLCSAADSTLLRAEAPPARQAQLFLMLLRFLVGRRRLLRGADTSSTQLRTRCDQLLQQLCSSSAVQHLCKTRKNILLPLDLCERYRTALKSGRFSFDNLSTCDTYLKTRLESTRLQHKQVYEELDGRESKGELPCPAHLHSTLETAQLECQRLNDAGAVFANVFSSHLEPWMNNRNESERTLPSTGEAVHDAAQLLDQLNQVLMECSVLSAKGEQMRAAQRAVERTLEKPSEVIAALHLLAEKNTIEGGVQTSEH